VDLAHVEPIHVAAFVEAQLRLHSKPTVKVRLAALRMLFDWMVVGQVLPVNPAHAVRGPKHTQRRAKTPVLRADEARTLIDVIDVSSLPGLRDPLRVHRSEAQSLDGRRSGGYPATAAQKGRAFAFKRFPFGNFRLLYSNLSDPLFP
jgi:integrase